MARDRDKKDDGRDGGKRDTGRDGDTGRRGSDDQHSTKIDPKKFGKNPWGDR